MFTEIKSITADLDVPATFKLRDLEQEAVHKKLVAELQKDAALPPWSCRCAGRHSRPFEVLADGAEGPPCRSVH